MSKDELIHGYQLEIAYQKRMVQNLGKWFSLVFSLTGVGGMLLYYQRGQLLNVLVGIALIILGLSGMLIIGYGIYKGNINIQKVIKQLEVSIKGIN
ncbi:DUF202 domain-containing protein [Streptococcus suis]|uniref:DUF202 domain-containing protein n=1 Tax=Streptococcus suis TaxID=1307 RepID=A0A426G6N8_STRSU|nr:DUF202 domain-containing protein [Streptococcus suis]RRN50690.1 DUF202 domain-containing protein [Streptococcus suis]HEL1644423.1 DUF202 domain-containing protein [Streptococcus suis]HEM5042123.1 DUF202 domain-containing protein [Streptococcus suis]HEM5069855.1 DUF202 domain-containing protein [Streptococcus suis]HEM5078248.1 DUF202 domain-containing protein [Streptococcus suis]